MYIIDPRSHIITHFINHAFDLEWEGVYAQTFKALKAHPYPYGLYGLHIAKNVMINGSGSSLYPEMSEWL